MHNANGFLLVMIDSQRGLPIAKIRFLSDNDLHIIKKQFCSVLELREKNLVTGFSAVCRGTKKRSRKPPRFRDSRDPSKNVQFQDFSRPFDSPELSFSTDTGDNGSAAKDCFS